MGSVTRNITYNGFRLFIPDYMSKEFFNRCKTLGLIFNNGIAEPEKLTKTSKDCYAYIFQTTHRSTPYVGSSIDYEGDTDHYEPYIEYETDIYIVL